VVVARSILAAQAAGWYGLPAQLRKRAGLSRTCGPQWSSRFRQLLREAHVSMLAFARGKVD
jgi:hypothetical protein